MEEDRRENSKEKLRWKGRANWKYKRAGSHGVSGTWEYRVARAAGKERGAREIYKPVSSRIKLVPQRVDVQRTGKQGKGANRTLMSAFNL